MGKMGLEIPVQLPNRAAPNSPIDPERQTLMTRRCTERVGERTLLLLASRGQREKEREREGEGERVTQMGGGVDR